MTGVRLLAFIVQKPGPIDEKQGTENVILPPSGLVKNAPAIGVTTIPMPIMSGMSVFAMRLRSIVISMVAYHYEARFFYFIRGILFVGAYFCAYSTAFRW